MKKRLLPLFLAFPICLVNAFPTSTKEVHAEEALIIGGTDWELYDNGTLVVTSSSIRDYTLNSKAPWYEYRDQITAVEADSLYSIGSYAFYGCTELEDINLSAANKIGDYAFYGCESMKKVYFDPYVNIGSNSFNGCTSIVEVSIPADVSIGEYAFANCDSLKNIYISTGATITSSYFDVQENSFPDNDISLYYAKGQNVNSAVKTSEMGSKFQWKESLYGRCGYDAVWAYNEENSTLRITGTGRVAEFSSGSHTPWYLFDDLKYIVVENGITEITSYFFEYMTTVESVTFTNTLEVLERNAFNDCSSLNNILLPDSLKSFGSNSYKFNRCDALTDVYYEGTAEEWESIEFHSGVEQDAADSTPFTIHFLEYYANKPATCMEDGYEAYYMFDEDYVYPQIYAEDKSIIESPVAIPAIGHIYGEPEFIWSDDYTSCIAAFGCSNCSEVQNVECTVTSEIIPATQTEEEKVSYKAKVLFQNSTHTATVIKIVNHTIAKGTAGEMITWILTDDGILTFTGEGSMENYAGKTAMPWYEYSDQILSVEIGDGITTIGEFSFYGMPVLENVALPESVTNIGAYAFKNAMALKNITLPVGLTQLGESAFYACTALKSIDIPASLWTVRPYTFKNCTALEEVTFHEGNLMKISDGAFYNTAVQAVVLPDCLDILDAYVFKNCSELAEVTLGSNLTEIREATFYGNAISEITIPDNIQIIKSYAFKNCKNLVTVDFGTGLTAIGEASFYGCTALTKLSIPRGVAEIQGYAFKNCTSLEMISLPSTLTMIGDSVFHTCTGLTTITIPKNVASIGDYCFSGSGLKEITFLGNAPTLGSGVFKGLSIIAYYPSADTTWISDVMQNYGGSVTWKEA